MSSFDGQDLFSSGLHSFDLGAVTLRHDTATPPDRRGTRVTAAGVTGRAITQRGELVADNAPQMHALAAAIEAKLDGLPHTLVDHLGRVLPNTVMLAFRPATVEPLGQRVRVRYAIDYVQTTP